MVDAELYSIKSECFDTCEIETNHNLLYLKLKDSCENVLGLVTLKVKVPLRHSITPDFKSRSYDGEKHTRLAGNDANSAKLAFLTRKYETIIEQHKIKNELLTSVKDDLCKQKQSLEEMLSEERRYVDSLELKVKSISKDYSEALQRSEERDKDLLQKLSGMIKENSDLHYNNCHLEQELKQKESDLFYLKEDLKRTSFINVGDLVKDYNSKIQDISEMFYKSEKERDSLQVMIKSSGEITEMTEKILKSASNSSRSLETQNKTLMKDIKTALDELNIYKLQLTELKVEESTLMEQLIQKDSALASLQTSIEELQIKLESSKTELTASKQQLESLLNEKEKLEQELVEFKCKAMQSIKLERCKIDETDLALDKYFADQGLETLFVKISTGLYVYGTKKVNVSIKNSNLICRVNGEYLRIDEFIKQENLDRGSNRLSIASPLSSLKNSFVFPRHCKTNSLVSHLVSPKQKSRFSLSLDLENQIMYEDKGREVGKVYTPMRKLKLKRC